MKIIKKYLPTLFLSIYITVTRILPDISSKLFMLLKCKRKNIFAHIFRKNFFLPTAFDTPVI